MSFINKVVVITGAGSGIGEAIAIHFAKLCATLSLIDINSDTLSKVAERCENLGKGVLKLVTDVSKEDNLKQAVDKTIEEFSKIDVVINCAGVFNDKGILDADVIRAFDNTINVNLRGMVVMTHYTAKALIESKGCIINIASVKAQVVSKYAVSYNVSKAGVVHFTKNVALELADKGVRVNCISPGPVKTNIILNAGNSQEISDSFWEQYSKHVPLGQNVPAEDIAEMAEYLASDKAKCITGADFVIDSGVLLIGVK